MTLLTRDAILAATDIPSELVQVPEWGGSVRVVGMTARERSAYENGFTKEVDGKDGAVTVKQNKTAIAQIRERLLVQTVVGEDGAKLFTEADIEALGKKSAAAMERVLDVARRVCGMSKADLDELGNASGETEGDGSSSD